MFKGDIMKTGRVKSYKDSAYSIRTGSSKTPKTMTLSAAAKNGKLKVIKKGSK